MTNQTIKPSKGSPRLTAIVSIAFCLAAVPAVAGEPAPPGQFAMQWLAMSSRLSSPTSEKPIIERPRIKKPNIDKDRLPASGALSDEFLLVVCRDRRWRDYAASLGGERYLENLCLQRLEQQEK